MSYRYTIRTGCPDTTLRHRRRAQRTYFIQSTRGGPVKIGRAMNVLKRLKQLQAGQPDRLKLLATLPTDCELELHARFAMDRIFGEWFKPTPDLLTLISTIDAGGLVSVRGRTSAPDPIAPQNRS